MNEPCFLNVDLEIQSTSKLDSLAERMGNRVIVLYCGRFPNRRYVLVLESSREHRGPDATIHALCSVVENLPPAGRRIWTSSKKEFDIGYDFPLSETRSRFTLRPDTLKRLVKLGAGLAVSYYRREDPKQQKKKRKRRN